MPDFKDTEEYSRVRFESSRPDKKSCCTKCGGIFFSMELSLLINHSRKIKASHEVTRDFIEQPPSRIAEGNPLAPTTQSLLTMSVGFFYRLLR